jgi:tRNA A37 threonylcarbamoyladenosine synthetase subunit TsaC/SUA5/YrdC
MADVLQAGRSTAVHQQVSGSPGRQLFLGEPADEAAAADRLADGGMVGFGFGNFYALATRPEADMVRAANRTKGRPPDQVGSLVTTPGRVTTAFDWSALPAELDRRAVLGLLDALFAVGPFGFRGPAADTVPGHLGAVDSGIRTTQLIGPGYSCPSSSFLAACLHRTGGDVLYITSANRSHHSSGAAEEPAHHRADALAAEFGDGRALPLLRHRDETLARSRYPRHAPMSTTILALHRTAGVDPSGRVRLVVERHGSLPVQEVRRIVRPLGLDVVLGAAARARLPERTYPAGGSDGGALPVVPNRR